jgi:putative endonuclease
LIVGDYLKRLGWKIVARGAESRYSEIDLVAVDGQCIVFVEVKSRTGDDAEAALDAVDWDKQRRLTRAALAYLKRHRLLEHRARFDVVALNWRDQQEAPELSHIRDAFPAVGRGQFYA